jgi:hypothetical protein
VLAPGECKIRACQLVGNMGCGGWKAKRLSYFARDAKTNKCSNRQSIEMFQNKY